MIIPNLLLIAGTCTKSGKTSLACRIIEQFKSLNITAIKISPHFHETTPGLKTILEETGYGIYEETDMNATKDTARMLRSGASKVYFAKVVDKRLKFVFDKIMDLIPECTPIICESPALRNFIEPGLFIIITSETTNKHKNISHLQSLPHVMFKLEELKRMKSIPVLFEKGKWHDASMYGSVATDPYIDFPYFSSSISAISFPSLAFILSRSCFIPATA